MKQFQNGNLVETFQNLIGPESLDSSIDVQPCGCLSGCGKGPNVSIEMKDYEKVQGAIEDPLAAALLLNAECSYRCDNTLIAACNVMAQARECKYILYHQVSWRSEDFFTYYWDSLFDSILSHLQ